MTDTLHGILMIVVIALVTMLTRFLPFLIFRKREMPPFLLRLGRLLPCAIMGMLVVYCLKDTAVTVSPYGVPALLSCAAVVLLYVWKRNSLLSIGGGTICYMLLLQLMT